MIHFSQEGRVGILKINRPEALNALNNQLVEELTGFFKELPKDIRCLILTGEGKAFVAGADIKEFSEFSEEEALGLAKKGQELMSRIEESSIPVIAAVNGFALGGGLELALSCDFILASEKAKMGLPEVTLGVIPGYGGTQRLARNIGKANAKAVALSGDLFSAQKMLELGLVTEVVKSDDLMSTAMDWAQKIAQRGPIALNYVKRAIHEGYDQRIQEALETESQYFAKTFSTKDQKEGAKAFLEKRQPEFTGE